MDERMMWRSWRSCPRAGGRPGCGRRVNTDSRCSTLTGVLAMKRTRPRSLGCIVAEYQVLGGSVLVITCWLCGGSARADGLAHRGSMSRPPCR
jgi:hypothetical protein